MEKMNFLMPYQWQIVETIIVFVLFLVSRSLTTRFIMRVTTAIDVEKHRKRMINRIVKIILNVLFVLVIMVIWGVDQKDLLLFLSSMLTILGIAFFAQWSILSNVTSAVILFINHPAKVGSKIQILDKDFQVTGTISEIGVFFVIMKSEEGGKVTIPNSVFIQRMISVLPEE